MVLGNEQRNQCRDIARLITSEKPLLDAFKDKIEFAALVDCAKQNDPHPTYLYAYSYGAIIKSLLEFETTLKPEWVDPKYHPNGKMVGATASERSKAISLIKGQLRIDRGAKGRDERVAGFYAWLNAFHPVTCGELHDLLEGAASLDTLDFPVIVRDGLPDIQRTPTPKWDAIISKAGSTSLVSLVAYDDFGSNLVEISRASDESAIKFEFGAEFLFHLESPFEGHLVAVQTYKANSYPLPLSTRAGFTEIRKGENIFPTDEHKGDLIPLSEKTDMGVHQFVFFLFNGTPPHFDYTPFHGSNEAIHAETLEAFATKLASYPARHWTLATISVDFL